MEKNLTLEKIAELPVNIEYQTDDGAYEEAHIDTTYETKICCEVFSNEQIEKIKTMLNKGEDIEGFYIDDYTYFSTTGSKFARVRIHMNLNSGKSVCLHNYEGSMGGGRALVVNYKEFELQRQRNPDEVEQERRDDLHKKIKSQTIIQKEEPINIEKGFITLNDLVILRAGTYSEHHGDIHGIHYHEKTELISQTLLFPFTMRTLSRLPKNYSVRKIWQKNKDAKKYCDKTGLDVLVNLSLIDSLRLTKVLNPIISSQGLEVQLPRKEPLEVLFCTPQYSSYAEKLPPVIMTLSRNIYRTKKGEDIRNYNRITEFFGEAGIDQRIRNLKPSDKVEYLNLAAGAGLGDPSAWGWYREGVNSNRHKVLFEVVPKNK
ncbi:hypothetical protein A3K73_08940 [Candidatus Pacearchaeota archaeon RBG_13_36_9]|nr:MAG: hypothetical protein A3K73_08940 [Candidatus Pacearchaeota archaeon RBG_13_36_9]